MKSSHKNRSGFTLIELLVVIAIIGILSTFVMSGLPRILRGAKVADARSTMNQIRLALEEYFATDGNSYPPAYGYLDKLAFTELDNSERKYDVEPNRTDIFNNANLYPSYRLNNNTNRYYVSRNYMHFLNNFSNTDLYDRFSRTKTNNDTDFSFDISRLEYVPRNGKDNSIANYSNNIVDGDRPFVYVPVNMRQFKKAARQWIKNWQNNPNSQGPRPDDSVAVNIVLQDMHFPPPKYDAYVLISMGPDLNTRGIIYDLVGNSTALRAGNYAPNYRYHVAALATFFMATRDLNVINVGAGTVSGDDSLDFEYSARTGGGQNQFESNYYPITDTPGVLGPLILIGGNFDRGFEDGLVAN